MQGQKCKGEIMDELLVKLVRGEKVSDKDIEQELYYICDSVHASCDIECPVYWVNGAAIPWNKDKSNCRCFKDGRAMLKFIRTKKRIGKL